ncbi:(Fe-S)-binding protein [Geotalea toluenoxydans]
MSESARMIDINDLPGLNCGVCGFRLCEEFAARLKTDPGLLPRCIHLSTNIHAGSDYSEQQRPAPSGCGGCLGVESSITTAVHQDDAQWTDSLGREFDFYLEHFPEEPGPREIIIPHNPIITREMEIAPGDILIGRPLGMSCGCPITHCGVVKEVDLRTGVIVWCVTGPLTPREKGFKDMGYYIAEGYEGLIAKSRVDPKIGMRYYFQPSMCMLQWRHSGLVNYLNRTESGLQVRVEGLWIG